MKLNQIIALILFLGSVFPLTVYAHQSFSLREIELMAQRSLPVQSALANIKAAQEKIKETKDKSGFSLHAGFGIGEHHPLITSNITPSYFGIDPQVSISYPLLGTNSAQQEETFGAVSALSISHANLLQTKLQVINLADTAFLLYWQSKETHLFAEKLFKQLNKWSTAASVERKSGSWSIADWLYFEQAKTQASSAINKTEMQQETSLSALNSLLGTNITSFRPIKPHLDRCTTPEITNVSQDSDPTIKILSAQLNAIRADQNLGPWRYIDATANLGIQPTYDPLRNRVGYSVTAGVQVSVPIDLISADNAHASKLAAQAESLELQILQARDNYHQKIVTAINSFRISKDNLAISESQFAAAKANWDRLHAMMLSGPNDVFLKAIKARLYLFEAETIHIGAIASAAAAAAKLRNLDPTVCKRVDAHLSIP